MTKIDVMLWNQGKTESVRASKIRSFGVYKEASSPFDRERFKLLGWYNANESFYFGCWETEEEARAYLEELHKQIEGK